MSGVSVRGLPDSHSFMFCLLTALFIYVGQSVNLSSIYYILFHCIYVNIYMYIYIYVLDI